MHGLREQYPALFQVSTMQQFMWQRDVLGVAHFIKDCFAMLAAPDAPDSGSDISSDQP
jgi:hypothetical protein